MKYFFQVLTSSISYHAKTIITFLSLMGNITSDVADGVVKLAAATAVTVGNTVGQFVPWQCGHCGDWSRVARYSGNVVQGGIRCPTCGH